MKPTRTEHGRSQLLEQMILSGQGFKSLKRLEPPARVELATY